ncbi:hypothetical protein ACTWPT_42840 [Nonomuraea sp. 3N208]|uniref:hypothetical protein n=1 Tax=Nonomuraea sp. 3N208 TaxID=3457421 RepID=UPI003FD166C7
MAYLIAPLTPADPHRLGDYWLAGRLGAGGQGVVYEAYGLGGERVAVKVPRFDSAKARARLAKDGVVGVPLTDVSWAAKP